MSDTGKLLRGLKWYGQRDASGFLPEGISDDPEKMKDVEFYKAFIEGKDEGKIKRTLANLRHLARHGRKRTVEYEAVKKKLMEIQKVEKVKTKKRG